MRKVNKAERKAEDNRTKKRKLASKQKVLIRKHYRDFLNSINEIYFDKIKAEYQQRNQNKKTNEKIHHLIMYSLQYYNSKGKWNKAVFKKDIYTLSHTYSHTYTQLHTHIHTNTQTYSHTHIDIYINTHKQK